MTLYYLHDGSFSGLMTAISESISVKTKPENFIQEDLPRNDLFGDYISISSDETKSDEMITNISDTMGDEALSNIMYCYLSNNENSGRIIYNYILFGMNTGRKTDLHLTDNSVMPVLDIVRKVKNEYRRLLGLVRFRLVENGLYYASIDPDHNIISLIAPHFARRMADQNWIIHDTGRKLAVVYDKKSWKHVEIEIINNPENSHQETFYRELWKNYFKNITISERKNPKLQKQFLPKRYWKNLTEMN